MSATECVWGNCDCMLYVLWVEVDVCRFVCGKRDVNLVDTGATVVSAYAMKMRGQIIGCKTTKKCKKSKVVESTSTTKSTREEGESKEIIVTPSQN